MDLDFLNLNANGSVNESRFIELHDLKFNDYIDCNDSTFDLRQFFRCTGHFMAKSLFTNCFYFMFSLFTTLLNLLVICLIYRHRKTMTVFDKIFIGHALVDCLVGLLVIPLFCIYEMFGYWPLGKLFCHFYISIDYTICHVGILHMVYLSYARLRSLISPKSFQQELLIAHTNMVMFGLWIFSALLWIPSVNLITYHNYKSRECLFSFDPIFIIIQGK